MKIAILHEMLIKLGGAEKVVEQFLKIFPEADLFTLIYDEKKVWNIFPKNKIHPQTFTLKSQKIYNITKNQRWCLPFMAQSVESLNFSEYDVVLCSSSGFAHGAITKPDTKFIVYYHSPARYMWDWTNEYKKDIGWNIWIKWYILNKVFLKLRQWDYIASKRVDISLANSHNTQNRITKYYRNDSEILYPPVEVNRFQKKGASIEKKEEYYIIISALTEFKKIETAIHAFNNMPEKKLMIIGEWNFRKNLEDMVTSTNILFTWAQYENKLVESVQKSSGLIFPGEEDFWIVPIEVMAAGKPVFAYRWWGLLETIQEWITWEFFTNKNGDDFIEAFQKFHAHNITNFYTEKNCQKQAQKFSEDIFEKKIKEIVYNS